MAKAKALAGKSGSKYGNKAPLKKSDATKPKKAKSSKSKVPKSGKKALVPKEVMDAMKENRKEKMEKREKQQQEKRDMPAKKRQKTAAAPKEPLKKKALKQVRKAHDNEGYENITKIKKLWEKAREKHIEASKRREIIIELKKLMEGKIASLMFKHDLARVVQMILKFGKREHKNFIIEELKPHIRDLAKSKYSKFTIKSMLKHSTPVQRNEMFKSLSGHFKKLTLHSNAVTVVDTLYNDYCNSKQRTEMITEFYGKEFYLFRDLLSEHLSAVLKVHPDKKDIILEELFKLSQTFIEKGLTGYIVVQHLMLQYFLHAPGESVQELISDKLIEQVVNFVHTKDGSKIAMRCLWYANAKQRKFVIKSFKGHVKEMSINENGYLVLCALFDCVDDTILVKKTILSEIIENLDYIVMSAHGRKIVNYLLAPRTKTCHPDIIEKLSCGDNNAMSKKETSVRSQEILTYASTGIIENFSQNVQSLLMENATCLLISNALLNVNCDITPLLHALVDMINADVDSVNEQTVHIVLRNTLGSTSLQKQFSELLIERIPMETFKLWLGSNKGAFTLWRILEHKSADNSSVLVDGLKQFKLEDFPESAGKTKLADFLAS